ncbi:MAG: anhydro-N-acetylmuramic acid kinase [Wenzhouxiangellaceae bacterium]
MAVNSATMHGMNPELFAGLISGTSMDGIDAALVDFDANPPLVTKAGTRPYPARLRAELEELRADPDIFPAARLARLDAEIGQAFADAANQLLANAGVDPRQVRAIGSHGQTILHRPDDDPPHTLQIGDPARIAAATGIDTVADFRRADLAAGGQGAPLAPLLHHALLASPDENRLVVNLGGIANITLLPANGGVSGFDTGPANCFLDLWYRQHHDDQFDRDGRWAASGRVDESALARLLDDPYFDRAPPKSTGIEYFNPAWLSARQPDWAEARPADFQATLAEFSAASLIAAIEHFVPFVPDRVLICGGGVHNTDLLDRIRHRLPDVAVQSTAEFGIDPDFAEAILFAWLARGFITGKAIETGPVTGAMRPVRLGAMWPAN